MIPESWKFSHWLSEGGLWTFGLSTYPILSVTRPWTLAPVRQSDIHRDAHGPTAMPKLNPLQKHEFFCSSNLAWKMIRSLLSDPSDRPDVKTQTFRPPVETNISRFENPLLCLSNGRILRKELQPLICKVSGSPGKAHQKSTIKSGPSFFWWKQNVQMTVSL